MSVYSGTLWAVVLSAALAACVTIQPGHEPPIVDNEDITTWLIELDHREGHTFHARNNSDFIYRVTSVTLRECVNLREPCGTRPMNVLLCPGDSKKLLTVHAEVRDQGQQTFFRWDYEARRYEPDEPVVGAECDLGG